jgi:cell wall-associated NlpC family hydrolase
MVNWPAISMRRPARLETNIPMSDQVPTLPDARRHAWRADLADEALRGSVVAPRYVGGERQQVVWASVPVRKLPDVRLGYETELLFGEEVQVFDDAHGWAWIQALSDRYVGYVPADALAGGVGRSTHRVRATATFVYPEPNIKTPPIMVLSLNAPVRIVESQDRFAVLAGGGFVLAHHIVPGDQPARDFVDIAERFEGTPYLWGGRTRVGVDCSGLVQLAMHAAALTCPRDTDMQRAEVGVSVDVPDILVRPEATSEDVDGLLRGDLIFWPGHVGVMTDGHMLLHANGHHMSTVVEPVVDAATRIHRQTSHGVVAVRRPVGLTAAA